MNYIDSLSFFILLVTHFKNFRQKESDSTDENPADNTTIIDGEESPSRAILFGLVSRETI